MRPPSWHHRSIIVRLVVAMVACMTLIGACSESGDESDTSIEEQPADDPVGGDSPDGDAAESGDGVDADRPDGSDPSGRDERRPTVRLGVTAWTGARLNVAIAEELIERRLSYPVDVVEVTDIRVMLDQLESGELQAVLELWPSTLEEPARDRIEAGPFADLGELGVEGKVGWWVPRTVADDLGITDWEDLAEGDVAAAFASPSTGSQGRFLGTDPLFEQYDEELIEALELDFVVEYSGSEDATAAELETAIAQGQPILLYWWTPTALVARFDLVNVALPERTDQCVEAQRRGELTSCDYPVDRLFKLGSAQLEAETPDLHQFLQAFTITTDQQLELIDLVENQGWTVADAAARWIDQNQSIWEGWLE